MHESPDVSADAAEPQHPNIGASADAEPLPQYLARTGRLPAFQGLAFTLELLSALQFAHARGWVHGAVTPANLFVSRSGRLLLQAPDDGAAAAAEAVDDVHGAAQVAWTLLTGTPAPQSPPGPVAALRPALPPTLDAVFERALAGDAATRYATASGLALALQAAMGSPAWKRTPALLAGEPEPAVQPQSQPEPDPIPPPVAHRTVRRLVDRQRSRSRHRVGVALAAMALAALLVALPFGAGEPRAVAGAPVALQPQPEALPLLPAAVELPAQQATPVQPLPIVAPAETAAPAAEPVEEILEDEDAPARRSATPRVRERERERVVAAVRPAPVRPPNRVAERRMVRAAAPDCRQGLAVARDLCLAYHCSTDAFRGHPVCLRLHAERRQWEVSGQREERTGY